MKAGINDRDELKIPVNAKLDGRYAAALNGVFAMDIKCFFDKIKSVLIADGAIEEGTGEVRKKRIYKRKKVSDEVFRIDVCL